MEIDFKGGFETGKSQAILVRLACNALKAAFHLPDALGQFAHVRALGVQAVGKHQALIIWKEHTGMFHFKCFFLLALTFRYVFVEEKI